MGTEYVASGKAHEQLFLSFFAENTEYRPLVKDLVKAAVEPVGDSAALRRNYVQTADVAPYMSSGFWEKLLLIQNLNDEGKELKAELAKLLTPEKINTLKLDSLAAIRLLLLYMVVKKKQPKLNKERTETELGEMIFLDDSATDAFLLHSLFTDFDIVNPVFDALDSFDAIFDSDSGGGDSGCSGCSGCGGCGG